MNEKNWTVCLIEPNKYEGQIMVDMLRNAGVDRVRVFTDATIAMESLEGYAANIVIASFEMSGTDGATWTRQFRRNKALANRKAAVFVTSAAFSRTMAEECRHAGANALIGKPLSAKVLLATINKVLGAPRPFIDGEGYVGPCRRAGIVTAGPARRRRKADSDASGAAAKTISLEQAVEALAVGAAQFVSNPAKAGDCEAPLRFVQAYAVGAGDAPLMRACASLALQINSARKVRPEAARAAIDACIAGIIQLATTPNADARAREAIAETARQAVAKAALQHAA